MVVVVVAAVVAVVVTAEPDFHTAEITILLPVRTPGTTNSSPALYVTPLYFQPANVYPLFVNGLSGRIIVSPQVPLMVVFAEPSEVVPPTPARVMSYVTGDQFATNVMSCEGIVYCELAATTSPVDLTVHETIL